MEKANGIVAELQELLGKAVFLHWPWFSKGIPRKWGHLRPKDMTREYLANLPQGNIGVALGEASGGLCAIDIDVDELVEPFLAVNPQLRDTLQTHGARGRVFWVRFIGEYPGIFKLKTLSGGEAGEFRSTGSQSIIWGMHPDTKLPYKFVVKNPAKSVVFHLLRWPAEISNPPKTRECTEEAEETEETEEAEETEELKLCFSRHRGAIHSLINSVEDALRVSIPDEMHQNNPRLFKLARAIKTLEAKGERFDSGKLESVFAEWYRRVRAKGLLRDGQSREEYLMEFMNACEKAKYPLGGVKVPTAWARATSQPLPDEAMKWENPKLRLLIAFLKQLQEMAGPDPFYITLRDCADFLELESHSTIDKWMGALRKLGYIKVDQPGNEHRATRYRYIWSGAVGSRKGELT